MGNIYIAFCYACAMLVSLLQAAHFPWYSSVDDGVLACDDAIPGVAGEQNHRGYIDALTHPASRVLCLISR